MRRSRALRSLVRSVSSIPLLPAHRIDRGLTAVAARAQRTGHWRIVQPLLRYMLGYWFSPANREIFSVYRCRDRTSNVCESDNAELHRSWREEHPSVWNFIRMFPLYHTYNICLFLPLCFKRLPFPDGVAEREDETYQDIKVLNRGKNPSRHRKASALTNDNTLLALWQDLDEGTISVSKFLRLASRTMEGAFHRALNEG